MTSQRWQRVAQLYEAALAQEPGARDAFVARECGGDADLLREVESLLAHDATSVIVDQSVGEMAAVVLEQAPRLAPGTALGAYRVDVLIGAGGMGEVYRARDTKLNRDVALKVLPDSFMSDRDRIARFIREAHVLASLNHPHIAAIHGLEDSGDVHALVLELVEGPTLADRIAQGSVPIDEALAIARQIADAFAAAHEQGIVHRDLKPANIKVRDDGTAKVLDFGLARPAETPSSAVVSRSPTVLSPAVTALGVILGTAAYMSPEQAKGRLADKRSDVWAFGCVLYEMLTGKRAFEGEDVSDTLASVIKGQPNWAALPVDTPIAIRRLLRRSLEKDPQRRLSNMADARLDIDDAIAGALEGIETGAIAPAAAVPRTKRVLPWMLVVALAAALVGSFMVGKPWRAANTPLPQHLTVELGASGVLNVNSGAELAISRDGGMLAFVGGQSGERRLYLRRLGQLEAVPMVGGAAGPFFSPDGQWIGFFSRADHKLKKISIAGGSPFEICDWLTNPSRGAWWGDDGYIVFNPTATRGNLLRVSSEGGKPEPLSRLSGSEVTHRWPQVLPGSKWVLFTALDAISGVETAKLVVQALPSGPSKVVLRGAYYGRYLSTGHLLYVQRGALFAVPFDLERLEITGHAVPIAEGVLSTIEATASWFDVSDNGTLVYVPGHETDNDVPLLWLRRDGVTTTMRAAPLDWRNPQFAPDGQRLAFGIEEHGQTDLWTYEWARDAMTRLTIDPGLDTSPVWAPDGRSIAFASTRGDKQTLNLYWQRADGVGDAHRLTESRNDQRTSSWHPTGKYLAFQELITPGQNQIMIVPIQKDGSAWKAGTPRPFLSQDETPAVNAMFSPDGRWVAYQSGETGTTEVFVRPFPGPGDRWQISRGGGSIPTWSRRRNELFYVSNVSDGHLMVVSYTVDGDSFRANPPQRWSSQAILGRPGQRSFDLHPDGERFVVNLEAATAPAATWDKVVLVTNFFEELRRRQSDSTR